MACIHKLIHPSHFHLEIFAMSQLVLDYKLMHSGVDNKRTKYIHGSSKIIVGWCKWIVIYEWWTEADGKSGLWRYLWIQCRNGSINHRHTVSFAEELYKPLPWATQVQRCQIHCIIKKQWGTKLVKSWNLSFWSAWLQVDWVYVSTKKAEWDP